MALSSIAQIAVSRDRCRYGRLQIKNQDHLALRRSFVIGKSPARFPDRRSRAFHDLASLSAKSLQTGRLIVLCPQTKTPTGGGSGGRHVDDRQLGGGVLSVYRRALGGGVRCSEFRLRTSYPQASGKPGRAAMPALLDCEYSMTNDYFAVQYFHGGHAFHACLICNDSIVPRCC
ncbi:hypothetical protein ACVJBD_002014 [Rhizobium mongolense]